MTHPQLQEILAKLRQHLKATYAERLISLILFGSQAREEANTDSDIDVLIVLNGSLDIPKARKQLSPFLAQLCLDYETLITCIWAEAQDWQLCQSPLFINIRREGIIV
ncbi:MAG: nucleotidyltransferase domain-containing protein [Cyanobacteria bacterium P01_A01_bin.114]